MRRITLCFALLVIVAGLPFTADANSFINTLSGRVWDEDGIDLFHICVDVFDAEGELADAVLTDRSGTFQTRNLPSGQYRARFTDCSESGFLPEWYDDAPTAETAVTMTLNGTTSRRGVDAVLTRDPVGGIIKGRAFDPEGRALSHVCVDAFDSIDHIAASDLSDVDGAYALRVPAGVYRIRFIDCGNHLYIGTWYGGETYGSSEPVPIEDGQTITGIDGALWPGDPTLPPPYPGVVTGRASDPGGGSLSHMCVDAYDDFERIVGATLTDQTGSYALELPAGIYRISFSDCAGTGYSTVWYAAATDFGTATEVIVGEAQVTEGIDAVMSIPAPPPVGGTIRGTVYDGEVSGPLGGACVDLFSNDGVHVRSTFSDLTTGRFELAHLEPAWYRIRFRDCEHQRLMPVWHAGRESFEDADPLVIEEGDVLTIEAALSPPPTFVDLAAEQLVVRPEPLDEGLPPTGPTQRIEFDIRNLGTRTSGVGLITFTICPRTAGSCREHPWAVDRVAPGERERVTFYWGYDSVGEVTITARVTTEFDTDPSNDVMQVDHYVLIGVPGVGVGFGPI